MAEYVAPKRTHTYGAFTIQQVIHSFMNAGFWVLCADHKLGMFPLLYSPVRFYLAFGDVAINRVHRRSFLELLLSPCSDFHYRIKSKFLCLVKAILPEDHSYIMIFYFWHCPLNTEMSQGSLHLLMMSSR